MRNSEYRVYVSSDWMRGVLLEALRHPNVECIIQAPGVRKGNDFFFDLAADSGIHAIYEPAKCEKDHIYADHLATRIAEYYEIQDGEFTVHQVHKHPPYFLHFSRGDRPANISLARQYGGVVNGLMFVNPEFNLKFWYIDEEGNETPAEYEVNDEAVHQAMPRKALTALKRQVEINEYPERYGKTAVQQKKTCDHSGILKKMQEKFQNPEAAKDLFEEASEVGHLTYISFKENRQNGYNIEADNARGKRIYFKTIPKKHKILVIYKGKKKFYQRGMLKRLLKLEGNENVDTGNYRRCC